MERWSAFTVPLRQNDRRVGTAVIVPVGRPVSPEQPLEWLDLERLLESFIVTTVAMASNPIAMASNPIAMASTVRSF